jgi:NAD(P)-dependent dehydrogenase (short-subunit alcohol dehydrogenase family)
MGQLDAKVAIITGAARSIGRAISKGLAREGASTVLADIDLPNLKRTTAEIIAIGNPVEAIPTDVISEEQIEFLFKKATERFGRLDILINNAGVFDPKPIDRMSLKTW